MKNTTDIAARAQVCAGCHVGQPDADGWPWRDVNHDLIAAGHPRLSFEFSAYMAMLPPHWNTKVNKDRFDELYSWLVGQLTTADAALRLLQCRAKSAGSAADLKDHKENSLVPSAWPELSEYDCYACHHGLAGQRWRQELAAPNRAASKFDRPARKSGAPAWGTWYYDGPRVIAQSELYLKAGKSTEFIDELNNLTASMQKPLPLVDEVLVQASQCARLIPEMQQASAIIAISRPPRTDANRIRQDILKSLAEQFERHRPESWDEFVQAYLAVVAMHRSEVNSTAQNAMNAERHRQIDELLQAIRNRLSFPSEASAPGAQLPSAKLRVLQSGINSPEQFDPDLRPAANSGVPGADKNLFELFDEAFRLLSAEATS